MFSDEGRTLDQETLEYAWMIEVQLGKLTGKLTAPQVIVFVANSAINFCSYFSSIIWLRVWRLFCCWL